MQVEEHVSLQAKHTFGIAAQARWYASVDSLEALDALRAHPTWQQPRLIMGGGSNLVFTRDWPGLVVHIGIMGISVVSETADAVVLEVGAGENWHSLVTHTLAQGWGGLENLALIPGTVGAAPVQNIGAYGVELQAYVVHVDAYDLESGERLRLSNADCGFGYRDSVFKHALKDRVIITHVTLQLAKGGTPAVGYAALSDELTRRGIAHPTRMQVAEAVISVRQSKLPDPAVLGNAGSFFKNPVVPGALAAQLKAEHPELPVFGQPDGTAKLPAGWLIEQAGLKGYRLDSGRAGVHARQALVLVNYGGATGAEILHLAEHVQATVAERFGVRLEREVNVV